MTFDIKQVGQPSNKGRSEITLFNSPAIMGSGISTIFLTENPNEICDRLDLLPQGKPAGNNSDMIIEEIVAIVDKLLEYKCISKKQQKKLLSKCLN